jgi:hypothetical protein
MTVSVSERVLDASEDVQPDTVCTLLREMGMSHACVEKQRAALGSWLNIHAPHRALRLSLHENGFGPLLKETDYKRARLAAVG